MSKRAHRTVRRNSECQIQCGMDGRDCRENLADPNSCRAISFKCQETRPLFECQREHVECNRMCDESQYACEDECPRPDTGARVLRNLESLSNLNLPVLRNVQTQSSCLDQCRLDRLSCLGWGVPREDCDHWFHTCNSNCSRPRPIPGLYQNQDVLRSRHECACCGQYP